MKICIKFTRSNPVSTKMEILVNDIICGYLRMPTNEASSFHQLVALGCAKGIDTFSSSGKFSDIDLKQGTQIIYVPYHADGPDHPDSEPGFVTSINKQGAFCRYWSKHSPYYLRTMSCSELTPFDRLIVKDTRPQTMVDNLIKEIKNNPDKYGVMGMIDTELQKWIDSAFGKFDMPLFSPGNIFEVIKTDQKILKRILLGGKFETSSDISSDTIHHRIKTYNRLIEPQLIELSPDELDKAHVFLLGFIIKFMTVEQIEEISDHLSKFIQEFLT